MKKQVIKIKVPRVNPRSEPKPSRVHRNKKRDRVRKERDKDSSSDGFNPFLR